uniref:Uncharacterized protein n=1 Tax=Oryzias latipes TaxID=8090 RepID=A0A3P9MM90_ORYLA
MKGSVRLRNDVSPRLTCSTLRHAQDKVLVFIVSLEEVGLLPDPQVSLTVRRLVHSQVQESEISPTPLRGTLHESHCTKRRHGELNKLWRGGQDPGAPYVPPASGEGSGQGEGGWRGVVCGHSRGWIAVQTGSGGPLKICVVGSAVQPHVPSGLTLNSHLQDSYSPLQPEPCSAVGRLELCLWSRLRCHQTRRPPVPQQVTIEMFYNGSLSVMYMDDIV